MKSHRLGELFIDKTINMESWILFMFQTSFTCRYEYGTRPIQYYVIYPKKTGSINASFMTKLKCIFFIYANNTDIILIRN